MKIDSIQSGIVLDHIKAGKSMQIYKYLGLDDLDCSVAIIKNASSNKMGKKDIIKIADNMDLNLDVLGYIDLDQVFKLTDRENRVYRCAYCESKKSEY